MATWTASRRFRWGYAVWLFGIFAYFVPGFTWNPVSRFDLVRSIVERHSVQIDWLASDTGDKAFAGGHWYSDKAPLPAVVVLPLYEALHLVDRAVGTVPSFEAVGSGELPESRILPNAASTRDLYFCSLATAAVAGTGVGLALFALLRRRTGPRAALFGSLAMTLGSPVFPYATSFYGHTCAAGCLLGGMVALLPADGERAPSATRLRWAGMGLAAAVGCEYITAVPVLVVLGWYLASSDRARLLPTCRELVLGALLPVVLVGAVHTVCYGAPWRTGYSHIADPEFAAGHAQGLLGVRMPTWEAIAGLLFGSERGLVYVAPVIAVLAAWWAPTLAGGDWLTKAAASAALALILTNAGYYMWWGGAAAVPRHLVPVVAFFALGAPALWAQRSSRWIGVALAVVSVANMLAITAVGVEAPDGDNVLVWVWQAVRWGDLADVNGASNLGIEMGLPRAGSLGPLLAWILVGLRLLWRAVSALEDGASAPAIPVAQPVAAGA